MKTTHTDLFPETLIVSLVDGHPVTNSLLIADHFGKKHKNVLKATKALIERTTDAGRRLNFEPSSYLNEQNKRQPMYLLTKDGFTFLAMGFTGPDADEWKWKFIDAFNAMESELHARTQRFANALDLVRPNLRPVVEGTQGGLSRTAIAAPLGKSCAAVTYHRGQARRLGLLRD